MRRTVDDKLYVRTRDDNGNWTFKRLKHDRYVRLEHCCDYPTWTLVWEASLGYDPFIHCGKCNHAQYLEGGE